MLLVSSPPFIVIPKALRKSPGTQFVQAQKTLAVVMLNLAHEEMNGKHKFYSVI